MNKLTILGASLLLATTTVLMAESDSDYRCGHQPYGGGYGMQGQGMMQGQGYGMQGQGMQGQGMMNQGQGMQGQADYEPIPEAKAKKMIEQYLQDNLKGFTIVKFEKQRVPMGIIYLATVKDGNGNEFELHLNPWGYIRGPFVK